MTTVGSTNSRAFEGHAHRDGVSSQNATERHLEKRERERNMTRNTDVKKMKDGGNDEDVFEK